MAISGYTAVHAAYLLRRQRLEAGNRGLEVNPSFRDGNLDGFAQLLVRLVIRKSFVNGEDMAISKDEVESAANTARWLGLGLGLGLG